MKAGKGDKRRVFGSVHFLITAGVLLAAAVGLEAMCRVLNIVFAKEAVGVLKPLEEFPESFGSRFELAREMDNPKNNLHKGKMRMTADVEAVLGTDEHITWLFKDNAHSTARSLAYVRVHLAYYTGLLDAVPHIADVCQLAGGAESAGASREVTWTVGNLPAPWRQWEQTRMRRSAFVRKLRRRGEHRSIIFYVFSVNGEQANDRVAVRWSLADPTKKHCYYVKIEISAGQVGGPLSDEQCEEMCQAFFSAAAGAIFQHLPSAERIQELEDSR